MAEDSQDLVAVLSSGAAVVSERMRAAAERMAHDGRTRAVPVTKERREAFLTALRAGIKVSAAARYAGCSERGMYRLRASDEAFAKEWTEAWEASIEALEDRLEAIAFDGKMDSMSTVRAAETLLRGRSKRYQIGPGAQAASVKVDSQTGQISVSVGTGID